MKKKQQNLIIAALIITGLVLYWYFNLRNFPAGNGESFIGGTGKSGRKMLFENHKYENKTCKHWVQTKSKNKAYSCAASWCNKYGKTRYMPQGDGHLYTPQWCVPKCALPEGDLLGEGTVACTNKNEWYDPYRKPFAWKNLDTPTPKTTTKAWTQKWNNPPLLGVNKGPRLMYRADGHLRRADIGQGWE